MHTVFWLLLFLLPYLLQPSFEKGAKASESAKPLPGSFHMMKFVFWMVVFYVNAHILLPRFLYKKRRLSYSISLLLVLVSLSLLELLYFSIAHTTAQFRVRPFLLFNFFPFVFFLACSTTYRFYLDRREAEQKQKERETETLKTELLFLRSQMSPHFMFNVLNNMVALARKKSDLLEPSLLKLSSLMRYFLYEADEEKVSLEKEIGYLQSYIDLQQQRFGKNMALSVQMTKDSYYGVEPMLLIPFVENAFKHGTGLIADAAIHITLEAIGGVLRFEVANKYSEGPAEEKDRTSGIGLANVQRRLDLLYGKNHTLQIEKEAGWFRVRLQLNLT
jgi:sensor histidine kinase YesM